MDRVGQAANVMQFTGVDALGLVSLIVQAAQTARRNRNQCQKLSKRVQLVADLLGKLGIPVLRQHQETRRPLEQLRDALISAYLLVRSCTEKRSQLYQMFTGADVASKLREAQEEIDFYIKLIPMITLVAAVGTQQATNEVHEDESNDTAPTQGRLPGNGLSLQYVTQSLILEELQPQGFDIDTEARSNAWHLVKKNVRNGLFGQMGRYLSYRDKSIGDVGPRRFSYAELKQATRDFSDVVGRGAYATLYRGELPDGRAVAVKQLHGVGSGEAEFWGEVTILAQMHHLNLVRMWGFCAKKDQRMLVLEYVPNGSLDKYLFAGSGGGGGGEEDSSSSEQHQQPLLDLHTRYRIAFGVARGIAYLHEECPKWVLHCDIKPENILLDDDFCPKLSDFGMAKLTSKEEEEVTMSRIRGTLGYIAPEWVIHREPITAKADVYSFGMVLLEIVSGRRNYGFRQESVGSEDWYFPKWAYEKVYVERRIDDFLDPRIAASYDDDASVAIVERMVKTAIWCLQDRAEMRPSMGKVAKMLEGYVKITDPVNPTIFCVQDD